MSLTSNKSWIALFAVVWFLGSACSMENWQPQAPEQDLRLIVENTEQKSKLDSNRDLCLFGRGDLTRDIAFYGRAASNIQQHTTKSDGVDFDPDVDATGQKLIFASTRHSKFSHLYMKPLTGTVLTQITDGPANDVQPMFGPDDRRIAFASDRSGQWDVWVIEANGRNPIQITNNPAPELHPSWSPDGKRLTYCRISPQENRGELWIVELDNPGVKRLVGEGLFPDWSPKGDKIVYQRARARGSRWFSIWTLDINGDEVLYPTEIASTTTAALIAPVWSPEGTQIAFTSVAPAPETGELGIGGQGRADIGIVDADGRGFQKLTDGRGENYSPAWSPDGRVFFTAKLSDCETIWSIKTFKPQLMTPPATGDRRAAAVLDVDFDG